MKIWIALFSTLYLLACSGNAHSQPGNTTLPHDHSTLARGGVELKPKKIFVGNVHIEPGSIKIPGMENNNRAIEMVVNDNTQYVWVHGPDDGYASMNYRGVRAANSTGYVDYSVDKLQLVKPAGSVSLSEHQIIAQGNNYGIDLNFLSGLHKVQGKSFKFNGFEFTKTKTWMIEHDLNVGSSNVPADHARTAPELQNTVVEAGAYAIEGFVVLESDTDDLEIYSYLHFGADQEHGGRVIGTVESEGYSGTEIGGVDDVSVKRFRSFNSLAVIGQIQYLPGVAVGQSIIKYHGIVRYTLDGIVNLQWGKKESSAAGNVLLKAGSYIQFTKLSD